MLLWRVFQHIDGARVDRQLQQRFPGACAAVADERSGWHGFAGAVPAADASALSVVRRALRALQVAVDGGPWPPGWKAAADAAGVTQGLRESATAADSLAVALALCRAALAATRPGAGWSVERPATLTVQEPPFDRDEGSGQSTGWGLPGRAEAVANGQHLDGPASARRPPVMPAADPVLPYTTGADRASTPAPAGADRRIPDAQAPQPPDGPARHTTAGPPRAEGLRRHWHDEWDLHRQGYRRAWTCVHERHLEGADPQYLSSLRVRHAALSRQIRRRFSQARPAWRDRVPRAADGDRLDLDAAVASWVDRQAGHADDGRVYIAHPPVRRDLAVALLLDTSGSTGFALPDRAMSAPAVSCAAGRAAGGPSVDDDDDFFHAPPRRSPSPLPPRRRVIDVARDAVALVCEGLQALGDRHAVFGFTGQGRLQVDFHVAKAFDEAWSAASASALAALQPGGATRTGAALRHALWHLAREPARRKLLLLVTDGYPQDSDYGPDPADPAYGLHDTARALREAQRAGVTPFCISIDGAGHDHLRGHCPRQRYLVIDEVDDLPQRLVGVLRRLAGT